MLAAGLMDVRTRRIPNCLVIALAVLACLSAALESGLRSLGWPWALIILGAGILAWKAGIIGAGDVKLAAACLLWFPLEPSAFLMLAALLGGLLALAILVKGLFTGQRPKTVPYGVALGLAGAILLSWRAYFLGSA
jgi:prepilin peptidase CpaA